MALQLESARFRGDPVLERIRAADTSAYLQYGLIDLDYAIPSGATGFFGNETPQAVTSFKQDEGLRPAAPVVGVETVTRLDGKWAEGTERGPGRMAVVEHPPDQRVQLHPQAGPCNCGRRPISSPLSGRPPGPPPGPPPTGKLLLTVTSVVAERTWTCLGEHVPQA
ncbi:peptidoglycan-binding domain-containing protein [Streptomyces gardneri]|uniref:peptidoglycan-binding domain-containing protein n=1 Tax=Streptomyces gardneri TaxID=66892 RepID=UPI0036B326EF